MTNPLFNSELEFQFYLAWKIKELYKDAYKICIEYPMKDYKGHNRNIDLVLISDKGYLIPIELKYNTNEFQHSFNGVNYNLKAQSANDMCKYGHLKDVSRIEYFKEIEDRFLVGYAITVTNQSSAWKKISSYKQTDFEFSLEDGSVPIEGIYIGEKESYPIFENRFYDSVINNDDILNAVSKLTIDNPIKAINRYSHNLLCDDMGIDLLYASSGYGTGAYVVLNNKCMN